MAEADRQPGSLRAALEDLPELTAPEIPAELMAQAEEASRAFTEQAEEATKRMEEYLQRGERAL